MRNWFLQKNDSEQKIIVSLAGFSLLMLLYAFVFLPLKRANAQLQNSINDIEMEVTMMQNMEHQISQFSHNTVNTTPIEITQLMVLIEQTAAQQQIKLSDMKPQENNKIFITLHKIAFNSMIQWLDILKTQYHISITNLNIEAEKKGFVNVTLVTIVRTVF